LKRHVCKDTAQKTQTTVEAALKQKEQREYEHMEVTFTEIWGQRIIDDPTEARMRLAALNSDFNQERILSEDMSGKKRGKKQVKASQGIDCEWDVLRSLLQIYDNKGPVPPPPSSSSSS
jgi:hypothetical protein